RPIRERFARNATYLTPHPKPAPTRGASQLGSTDHRDRSAAIVSRCSLAVNGRIFGLRWDLDKPGRQLAKSSACDARRWRLWETPVRGCWPPWRQPQMDSCPTRLSGDTQVRTMDDGQADL